jgi:hypothetical protein
VKRLGCIVLLFAACNQGGLLASAPYGGVGGGGVPSDGGPVMTTGDLAEAADLQPAGKSCGEVIMCVVQCGFTNLTCSAGCAQGASPQAIQEAGALTLCAAQNCLSLGDGGINTGGIFQCLIGSCQQQVAGCSGLIPGT